MSYEPGTYTKGGITRVARNARDAVALVFQGYKREADVPAELEQPADEQPSAEPDAVEPGDAVADGPAPTRRSRKATADTQESNDQ